MQENAGNKLSTKFKMPQSKAELETKPEDIKKHKEMTKIRQLDLKIAAMNKKINLTKIGLM